MTRKQEAKRLETKPPSKAGCLTLTRKVGETILVGDSVEVTVKEIRKHQVRLGIVAPGQKILRQELAEEPELETLDQVGLAIARDLGT